MNFRSIFSDNGTLIDMSTELDNYHSETKVIPFVAAEDYIYVGSRFPFNSFYLKQSVVNDQSSVMSVSYWDGSNWYAAVDIIDGTSVNGVTLAQDGIISFVPDKNRNWLWADTIRSSGTEEITGLGDAVIYDHYWIRVSFSVDLLATTALSWMGHLFSDDDALLTEYPVFSNQDLKDSFDSGKSSWEEQSVAASKKIINHLISKNVINSGNQILDYSKLEMANVQRTATIVFGGMGDSYRDDLSAAMIEYKRLISKGEFYLDMNNNARVDPGETKMVIGRMYR